MNYSGVLNLIGNTPSVSPYLFQTFVVSLLRRLAEKQKKKDIIEPSLHGITGPDSGLDAVAPEGIDELHGPTGISIKFKSSVSESLVRRELETLLRFVSEQKIESALFVFNGKLTKASATIREIESDLVAGGLNVAIWDYDRLAQLVEENQDFVDKLVPRLSTVHLEAMVSAPAEKDAVDDWKSRRIRHISALTEKYRENNLTFFLGAGVSDAAGDPTWNQLLNDLFAELVAKQMSSPMLGSTDLREIVSRFVEINSPSPLVAGRYIRKVLSDDFVNKISAALYKEVSGLGRGSSATLNALVQLCVPRRTGPGVRAVVTYNFDDLLEEHLKNALVLYRTIFRANEDHDRDELPIYHVHGFLPRKREEYAGVTDSLLVFSEEGYHSLYRDPYFWANFIQLTLLRESSGLMVGLSLTDPNLRRLLEIASPQDNSTRHYAILPRMGYGDFVNKGGRSVVSAPEEMVRAFLAAHHQTEEKLYQELGVAVIWVEGFDEIPGILESIRKRVPPLNSTSV